MTIPLTATGEVASFRDVDQFQPAKTQFACGFFSCALVKAMAPVGQVPTQTVGEMIAEAETWYAQVNGDNSIKNTNGITLQELYDLIVRVGLHFQASGTDTPTLRAWLNLGYPLLVAGDETGFYDMGLGDVVPYPWTPAGSHIIVLTGVTPDGHFLVRDPANVTDLYNPQSLRPGPRKYDARRLRLSSATAIVPPWRPRPPAGFDPIQSDFIPVVPAGWRDDGRTLTAPNGHRVVLGFRHHVLTHPWDAANLPLEEEQGHNPVMISDPTTGSGTRQIFTRSLLTWTRARGVREVWMGPELLALQTEIAHGAQQPSSSSAGPSTKTPRS